MAYLAKKTRLGQGTSGGYLLPGIPNPLEPPSVSDLDLLGASDTAVNDVENFLANAATGNLTASQVASINANTNAAIAQAAAGNPDLTAAEQSQWQSDLTDIVNSGTYTGSGNLLADVQAVGSGVSSGGSGVLSFIENNFLLIFGVAAAFLIFRPDKAFK